MKQLKLEKIQKVGLLPTTTFLLLLLLLAVLYIHPHTFPWIFREEERYCDLFRGDWVPDPDAPYYTNETCTTIYDHQNCMKHGRPDTGFMRWRWKPEGCEVPRFDAEAFFDLVKGQSMAFVGDSVGRNQMQSLLCLLSQVAHPVWVNNTIFFFPKYNFTVASFWSTYLVKVDSPSLDANLDKDIHLHLDKPDPTWAATIESFDYVIVSVGRWFFRPSLLYEEDRIVGCYICHKAHNNSIPEVDIYYTYRRAFRATFAYLNNLPGYKGITFLRTYSPGHYENGTWNTGGDCVRTSPTRSGEASLDGYDLLMRRAQVQEFEAAEEVAKRRGLRYRLLDITFSMLLRPDGHPGRYGRAASENTTSRDCVHWCLPGPIDSWNDILLEMLKKETLKAGAS